MTFIGASGSGVSLQVLSDGSPTFMGTQGMLFGISDSLTSGVLMGVYDIAGLPILEVSANDFVTMGSYGANALVVSGRRVGIGLASPLYSLDVTGLSRFSAGLIASGLSLYPQFTGDFSQTSGVASFAALKQISGVIAASIAASAAGVSTLNGLSGAISFGTATAGASYPTLSISGSTFFLSGTQGVATFASGIVLGTSTVIGGGIAISNDLAIYRSAANTLTISGNSVIIPNGALNVNNGITCANDFNSSAAGFNAVNGSASSVAFSNSQSNAGNKTNGMFFGTNQVSFATSGIQALSISPLQVITLASGLILGNSSVTGGGIAFGSGGVNLWVGATPSILSVNATAVNAGSATTFNFNDSTQTARLGWGPTVLVLKNSQGAAAVTVNADTTTTFASGIILGNSTVTGGGIAFGPNFNLYSTSANVLSLGATSPTLAFVDGGSQRGTIQSTSNSTFVTAQSTVVLQSNVNVTALTIGTDQKATFVQSVAAKSYIATVSGVAIPVAATATGTYNIDFTNSAALQTITITGATLFSGVNYVAGGATTLRVNVSGNSSVPIRFPSAWANGWVTSIPTGLATGRYAVMTVNLFQASDTGVAIAFAVAP